MPADVLAPRATLASPTPYPVPEGGRLVFLYSFDTTDGFHRGTVRVFFADGRPSQEVATLVPALGDTKSVRALGEYARLFPVPIEVITDGDAAA